MINLTRIILPMIFLSAITSFPEICLGEEKELSSSEKPGIYEYDELNPPEVFFFPPERARWDGSKVTMKEWYTLTKLQKERFISEYTGELKKQYSDAIDIMGLDYLRALNIFSYYSDDKVLNEPSAKFIDKLLIGQGKIKAKAPY